MLDNFLGGVALDKAVNQQGTLSKADLKNVVRRIVLSQGNIFIKELLRSNGITIGSTKADFAENLNKAIDEGKLTQAMVEGWLGEIEGWGNQHVYLFEPPTVPHDQILPALEASEHTEALGRTVSYDFPEEFTLTAIEFAADHLSVTWHRSRSGWERAKSKDFQRDEGAERYEYRAYRERFDRSVVRFEWRLNDPFCAVLVQLPHEGDEHERALAQVWDDLKKAGIVSDALAKIRLNSAFKALSRNSEATVQAMRLTADGGHVELVSTLTEGGIDEVEALRNAHRGVDDANFTSADGTFGFLADKYRELSRTIKVHGYGLESRIRIWVQCKREDVFLILAVIWANMKHD